MKKFLFALSMLFFNIGAAIAIEFTDGDFVYSDDASQFSSMGQPFESRGDNVYVKIYTGSSSSVEIPSEVFYNDKFYRVTAVGYRAFANNDNIQIVDLSGMENIGSQAFSYCRNLSEVNNISSCRYINSLAFARTDLSRISFPYNLEFLGPGAFSNCTKLSEVYFPQYGRRIESYGAPFCGCTSLKELNIPDSNHSIIKEGDIYYTSPQYYSSKQVIFISRDATYIDLRGYDSYDCGVFENCSKLKTLILPQLSFNFSADTELWYGVFRGCNSLEEIRIYSGEIGGDSFMYHTTAGLEETVVYVPFGSASNFADYFPDSEIREFGMSVFFDSKYGKVSHYVADGSGNESLKDLTSGAMIESDFRFNIQPSSDAYIESITVNGEDVSTYLNGNDLDLNMAGFGSGKIEIVFGHIPSIYVSYNYAYGKIYADGELLKGGDYVIGNGSHYFVVVPNEGYYAQINYGGKVQTLPESNTLVLTPGERTPLNVQFKSNPAAYVRTSGHGEILYKGKVVKNYGSVYSDSRELKEMDFMIIPDDGCVVEKVTWNSKDCTDALVNHHLTVMPASASSTTLDVTFRSLEEATLTITSPNQHSVTHKYTEGATPEIAFEPASGWELHSVTLNGEPVDFDENNVVVTPALSGANELNAVYVAIGNGIHDAESYGTVKVTAYNHTINVANKPDDAAVTVYDLEGRLIATTLDSQIAIKDSYRYVVVKVTDQTFKIAL